MQGLCSGTEERLDQSNARSLFRYGGKTGSVRRKISVQVQRKDWISPTQGLCSGTQERLDQSNARSLYRYGAKRKHKNELWAEFDCVANLRKVQLH